MGKFLMLALALQLAGCAAPDQSRLGHFVTQTVHPGMPMDQALVRMQAEGFHCNAGAGADAVILCTRSQDRLLRSSCIERVDLVHSATAAKTLGAIDILEVKCPK